jgi:hypothetical protein
MTSDSDSLLDQLADYAAQLLDPAAAAQLERRLAADPELAALAQRVADVDRRITAELATPAEGAMPPEVSARLLDAISAQVDSDSAAPADAAGEPTGVRRGRRTDSTTRPATGRDSASARPETSQPGRGPGRRRRWLRGIATGAGALAAAGLVIGGLATLNNGAARSTNSTGLGGGEKAAAPAAASPWRAWRSDADYTPTTLPSLNTAAAGEADARPQSKDYGLSDLSRLGDPAALGACVSAVTTAYPGTVTSVGFAKFEGSPAVILTLVTDAGGRIVVAGPDCGLPGAGDDEVYVTPAR